MSRKKRKLKRRSADLEYFEMALTLNGGAAPSIQPSHKKTWSIHDLTSIRPLTPSQEDMFHAWFNGLNICAHGSAGTGKTFLALYLALDSLLREYQRSITIVRSVVPTRDVGHLPGTLNEKTMIYELPYHTLFHQLLGRRSSYNDLKAANKVEFITTSFIRGITLDDTVIVVDEGQNMTMHEIDTIMTRVGENTRVIFTGDCIQTDLTNPRKGVSGMSDFLKIIQNMNNFADIPFNKNDIVRSEFVRSWIEASENFLR